MHRRISRHRETGHQAGALVRAPVHPARGGARGAIVDFSQTPRECKPRRSTHQRGTHTQVASRVKGDDGEHATKSPETYVRTLSLVLCDSDSTDWNELP